MKLPITDADVSISQLFGENPAAYARFGLAGHNGVDVAMPSGTNLLAVEAGTVVEVAYDATGYGNYIKIQTPAGADWLYGHMADMSPIPVGQAVDAGELVGVSGNTGNSTGPHCHVGYRPDDSYRGGGYGGYVDPLPYLTDAPRAG